MGFFWDVDQDQIEDPIKKLFIRCSNPQTEEVFTVCWNLLSQSIGGGRISREGALDVRESRERRDKISLKKQKTPKFWIKNSSFQWGIFICFGRGKLTFGGSYNFKTG